MGQIWSSTETSWEIQSWTGSVDVKWSQISSPFPCIKDAEWLPHYSQFSRTTNPLLLQDTWRRFSSNQTQTSLQLIVQSLLVSSFESRRLASEHIDCAPLKLESSPFVLVPLSKAAHYTKDLGSVPELSHMLWFQDWLHFIKANTTGSFFITEEKTAFHLKVLCVILNLWEERPGENSDKEESRTRGDVLPLSGTYSKSKSVGL